MPRQRKSPTKSMTDANERLTGIKTIDPNLDLGNGLTVAAYKAKIDEITGVLEDYNSLLAQADEKSNLFEALERELRDWNERFLMAVAARYGKNSSEYEMAGGTRKSERKKPVKKDKNS